MSDKLKRQIRARMAETGETYTIARARILAERGKTPAPAKPPAQLQAERVQPTGSLAEHKRRVDAAGRAGRERRLPAWLRERPVDVTPEWWDAARACWRDETERLGREARPEEVMALLRKLADEAIQKVEHEYETTGRVRTLAEWDRDNPPPGRGRPS